MDTNLSVTPKTIQTIYSQYWSGKFLINRRYQRKLVWSIEEKEKFIDSIINGFPIPMILVAEYKKAEINGFEVLDGMQRLNAITSYIEGEFPVNNEYFNLDCIGYTKSLRETGELHQGSPYRNLSDSTLFLDYPVPFSVFAESDPEKLDECFRRINTGGKTLSKQDVRQAGALGTVPELISKLATLIRKDTSHSDIVDLRFMRDISLSNRNLPYGINIQDVFWTKNGIITYENMRMSRDEETIAHLISYIADPAESDTSAAYLDSIYNAETPECERLTRQINKVGVKEIEKYFMIVFSEIRKTLENRKIIFKDLVYQEKPNKTHLVFHVVFIAFYKALIENNMQVKNYDKLCDSISGLFEKHLKQLESGRKWSREDREKLACSVHGLILGNFVGKKDTEMYPSYWVDALETILNSSKTEQVCYDFKIGMAKLTEKPEFDKKIVSAIVKTLTAMTNTKCGDCYVFVGIADKKEDAERHNHVFNSNYDTYKDFCITGVNAEASMLHGNLDCFMRRVIQCIDNEPIDEAFKTAVKSGIISFQYHGKDIIIFKVSRGKDPAYYGDDFYRRNAVSVEVVESKSMTNFIESFRRESEGA